MPPTKSAGDWLSPTDAAAILGHSANWVSKLGRDKKLRVKKAPNNRHLYSKADVLALAEKQKGVGKKSRSAAAPSKVTPTGKVTAWLPIAEAIKLCDMTPSGVQWAARQGYIRRKKTPKGLGYAADDCMRYHRLARAKKPSKGAAPAKTVSAAPAKTEPQVSNVIEGQRMAPKQAQTAVQKARWVFEGLDMGAIGSAAEALGLLRNIVYEGGGQ